MRTSGLLILKTLCIFGLLAGIGIMEAISAAASYSVDQEVCERVGLLGGLCMPSGSLDSERPRARTKASLGSPEVPTKYFGLGRSFILEVFYCGLTPSARHGRFLMEVHK